MENLNEQWNLRELPIFSTEQQDGIRARQEADRLQDLRTLFTGNPIMALRIEAQRHYPGVPMKFLDAMSGERLSVDDVLRRWREDIIDAEKASGARRDSDDTVRIDEIIRLIKGDLFPDQSLETNKNPGYIRLSSEERQALIQKIVRENGGGLALKEAGGIDSGAGYLGYDIVSGEENSAQAQEIERVQADVARKFIDSILVKLQKYSIYSSKNLGAQWEQNYARNPDGLISFLRKNYGQCIDAFTFNDDDPAIKFLDSKFTEIRREFKIHLQPKKEYIPAVLAELVRAIGDSKVLQDSITEFKVALSNDTGDEVFPEIVIYPKLSKEDYLRVLKAISEKFNSRAEEMGSGAVPRRNSNLNKLVNVAQSGGDFKKMLDNLGLLDRYFDKNRNYGFAVDIA